MNTIPAFDPAAQTRFSICFEVHHSPHSVFLESKIDTLSLSALWPEKFSIPVLIMNGSADQQVDPSQFLQLALQLQQLGKTYGLIIYSGDHHFLQSNREDRDTKALAWFTRYRCKSWTTPSASSRRTEP